MKKRDLASLAIIGISAGLIVGGCQKKDHPGNAPGSYPSGNSASAAEQMSPDMQAFYSSLSTEAQKKFMQLDAQHKMMAVEMANQVCAQQNKCSQMGGCATAQHACAGKNSCKGQGGAPVKDPNKAVDIQYNNQMNQRQKTNGGMKSPNTKSTQSTYSQSTSNQSSTNDGSDSSSDSND